MTESFEFGSGHITLYPVIKNLSKELTKALGNVAPEIEKQMGKSTTSAVSQLYKNISSSSGSVNFSGIGKNFTSSFVTPALNSVKTLGSSMVSTLSSSARTAASISGAALAGIGSVAIAGGFTRALTENQSLAKLKAFGYEAQEIESILSSVNKVIDGTSFTKPETLGVTTQLLASGAKSGLQLEEILKQTGKLAEMGGVSFEEMGSIISKAFAGGTIYTEDINQLAERDIAIWQALADSMGTSVDEVKKSLSSGEVSFKDLQGAINTLNFDAALFASLDATSSFNNFFTSIKKIGQDFWAPIINNSAAFFNQMKAGMQNLQKNPSYRAFLELATTRLETLMAKAQNFATKFSSLMERVNFDALTNSTKDFLNNIKGFEPIIAGLALALSSGIVSKIPLIGGMFGGISLPVGLLLGLLTTLYLKFESFRGLFDSVLEGAKEFSSGFLSSLSFNESGFSSLSKIFQQIKVFIDDIDFSTLGSNVGNGLSAFFGSIVSIFKGAQTEFRPLLDSFSGLFEEISKVFNNGVSFDGENFGATIVKAITFFIEGLTALIPVVTTIVSTLSGIVTSDVFKTVIGSIIDVASFIISNEAVLTSFIGILAGAFAAKKISEFLSGFNLFSSGVDKSSSSFVSSISELIKGFFGIVRGILTQLSTLAPLIVSALPTIALVSALIVGVGGLLVLLEKMGVFTVIQDLITFLIEKVGQILVIVVEVLGKAISIIGDFLNDLADIFVKMVPVITDSIIGLVDAFGRNFVSIVTSLQDFMLTLAVFGAASYIGATAFALGLGEIALALAGLAGSSALGGVADFLSGKDGSSLETLTSLVSNLATFTSSLSQLPQTIETMLPQSFTSGLLIGKSIQDGLFSGFNFQYVLSEFNAFILSLQNIANMNPIKIQVDDSSLRQYRNLGGSGGSTNIDNSQRTVNVQTQNSNLLKELLKGKRGF